MADRYWNPAVAGNWSDTNSWAATDGGATGQTVPTSADNVFLTSTNVNNCTIDVAANCLDFSSTGGTGYTGTFAGSSAWSIYGSLTLNSGMNRTYTGAITFAATAVGKTITMNTKTFASTIAFNGVGGGWTLQDAFTTTSTITLTSGTLNTNGQATSSTTFVITGSLTRTLTLGASTITVTATGTSWSAATTTNLTFNANTSTIILSGSGATFAGGGLTYATVQLTGAATASVTGANTFTALTRTGTATLTEALSLFGDQTISGTFTCNGNSIVNRILVYSDTIGTARTISAGTVTVTNSDFRDITGAGVGSWDLSAVTGGSGDCGGNTNITFTTASNKYWVGNQGSWNQPASHWATTSGGAAGAANYPLPQDTSYFDANSFSIGPGERITMNVLRCGGMDFTGVTNTPVMELTVSTTVYGSVTFVSGMSLTQVTFYLVFAGRGSSTFTTNGINLPFNIQLNTASGTVSLGSALTVSLSNGIFQLLSGTFTTNNYNFTVPIFSSDNSNVRTLNMGSSTFSITSTSTAWNITTSTNFTLNAGTSLISFENSGGNQKYFQGGGLTYNNFTIVGGGTGINIVYGSNTFNVFTIGALKHVQFKAGTTQTVANFIAIGSSGNVITINSDSTGTHALTKTGGGVISCDWLSVQHSIARPWSGASGADTWYAGANSTNNQGVATAGSGWIFTVPPPKRVTFFWFFLGN